MTKATLPTPCLTLSKPHARRFMLAHQRLWPPRQLEGKAGIMDFIRHVGCIQFDPLNVVGRNPSLALLQCVTVISQSRDDNQRHQCVTAISQSRDDNQWHQCVTAISQSRDDNQWHQYVTAISQSRY